MNAFERRIETWMEQLSGSRLSAETILRTVTHAIEDTGHNRRYDLAPNHLTLTFHPHDYAGLCRRFPHIDRQISAHVAEMARQNGQPLRGMPSVFLLKSAGQPRGVVSVYAAHDIETERPTGRVDSVKSNALGAPPLAQLWRDGELFAPLERYVINIGRHADNHLVMDDPLISRHHCQLRLKNGRYLVVDLGSSHGTRINGHLVQEHLLTHSDVLQLGEQSLIYLEDESTERFGNAGETNLRKPTP